MAVSLLSIFILLCKINICVAMFLATYYDSWSVRNEIHYPYSSIEIHPASESAPEIFLWVICGFASGNLLVEIIDFILLWVRGRSGLNLIIEEIILIANFIFTIFYSLIAIGLIFVTTAGSHSREKLGRSFYCFAVATVISLFELGCSLIRVISHCRHHSFRSNTTKAHYSANQETVTYHD